MPPASSPSPPKNTRGSFVAVLFLPLVLVLAGGCGSPEPDSQSGPPPPVPPPVVERAPSAIQAGETLDVFVMEDESFSGSYTVRSTGDIIVPKLGRVKLAGLSAKGAEQALSRALQGNTLTKATVLIDRVDLNKPGDPAAVRQGTEVFLSGKVVRPGRYTLMAVGGSHPTIHQAVLQAGGFARFAHKKKAHVLRRAEDGRLMRIEADLLAIESGGAMDIPLAPGDIIVVPEKKVDFGL